MKKLLLTGVIAVSMPFISFAQTSATADAQVTATGTVATTAIADPGLIPGDFFYFLDRWGEALNTIFTFNKEKKARLHLEYAKERVAEMKEVLKKPEAKLADIADAKKNFDAQVADAAILVKSEKDKGSDVAGLARELSDELDASRIELKDILQGHQDNQGRAEAVIRAKLGSLTNSEAPQIKGLIEALNAITKEKGDAAKEESDIDTNLSDDQASFDEAMGSQVAALRHLEQAMRLEGEMGRNSTSSAQLVRQAQEAIDRGDFEAAKRISKDAERILEKVRDMRGINGMNIQGMGIPNASGTEMNVEGGDSISTGQIDSLEQGIKESEKMMNGTSNESEKMRDATAEGTDDIITAPWTTTGR